MKVSAQEKTDLGDVHQFDNNEFDEALKVLKEALKLKANPGGAIKSK